MKYKKVLALISFFAILTMLMGTVSAANWTVNPGGSIQSVIDNSFDNDTVIVNDNNGSAYTYTENLIVNKKLQLQAKSGGNVTIKALNSSNPVITVNSGGSGSTVQGFIIIGALNSTSGIYLNGALKCNITGNNLTSNFYGIVLDNSSNNNTIQNNIATNNTISGIYLSSSNNNTVKNNTLTNNINQDGIYIYLSNNNTITGNTATGNGDTGIISFVSNYNLITGNIVSNNIKHGIYLSGSNNNTIQNNTATNNTNYVGIYLTSSNNNTVTRNTATGNGDTGIIISSSNYNLITGNNASNNIKHGIYLSGSSNNTIQNNTLTNNINYDGIYLTSSNNNTITGNTATSNGDSGIVSFSSNYNTVTGNNASNNVNYGIYLSGSNNNTIQNNTASNNTNYSGIYISGLNNIIMGNTATSNGANGIYLSGSSNNTIQNNTLTNNINYDGIYLTSSNNNTITGNTATGNGDSGIVSFSSNYNLITGNNISNNTKCGIYFSGSNNNTVTGNTITGNQYGIYLSSSSANINFNRITGNSVYGLCNVGNGTVNATNNWWGTNTPIVSSTSPSDIYIVGGTVTYNPWLVLSVTASPTSTNYNSTITADLTRNNAGNNTSSQGNIPDNIPINFVTNLGTVTSPVYTRNGKASTTLNRGASTGTANVTTTVDGQTVQTNVTIANVLNINTGKTYSTIQSAISDSATLSGHVIEVYYGTYTENIVINKKITLRSVSGGLVTIKAANPSLNTITVNSGGNGTTIQGFTIIGATNSTSGIFLNGSSSCNITGNTLTGNYMGVYLSKNQNNTISGNTVTNSSYIGIALTTSNYNTIQNNNLTGNERGVRLGYVSGSVGSNYNVIQGNTISNSGYGIGLSYSSSNTIKNNIITNSGSHGIYVGITISSNNTIIQYNLITNNQYGISVNNSTTSINFNGIYGNSLYGLYKVSGGTVNATNNWWGSGAPVVSLTNPSDIGIAQATVTYSPWLVTYNPRTNEGFTSIQAAINATNTLNDDTILVGNGTYTENIVVNKKLTLMPVSGGNATIQAANSGVNVITVNSGGSGSTIQGFTIKGATGANSYGIYVDSANNCTIIGNNVTGNWRGIEVAYSNNAIVTGNTVTGSFDDGIRLDFSNNSSVSGNNATGNGWNGILLAFSTDDCVSGNNASGNYREGIFLGTVNNTEIYGNTFSNNGNNGIYPDRSNNIKITGNTLTGNNNNGIYLLLSNNNTIIGNNIANNYRGVNLYYSSANINFNRIAGNSLYGLYNYGNGIVNATNNWWGSNNPVVSSTSPSDIYNNGGTVTYDPWLILSISSFNTVTHGNYTSDILADLTHNNWGVDTSLDDNYVLDGILVNFNTTLGTINATASTINNIATSTLNSNIFLGLANVSATLDRQTVSIIPKVFTSIQAAIDDASNDGSVMINDGTYIENVVLNRKLNIISVNSGNATIKAANSSNPVITINSGGAGSTIQGFNINGATNSYGIYINYADNCTINWNNITNNSYGIYLYGSNNPLISGNNITNNTYIGIELQNSNNNTITENTIANSTTAGILLPFSNNNTICGNTITNTQCGISLGYADDNIIIGNIITDQTAHGIYLQNSNNNTITENTVINAYYGIRVRNSSANINFNRIAGNNLYKLMVEENSAVDATNSWWGKNNPTISSASGSDIYIVNGTVTYNPWLVFNVTSSCDRSDRTGTTYNHVITADLTHNNQGKDTTPLRSDADSPYAPYGIPLYFNTTLGNIDTSTITLRGRTTTTLSSTTPGTANVTTTLDDQQISLPVSITSINVLGIYNTRTGQGFETIQAAIDNVNTQNGDTITLADGTYTENIVIGKRITLTPVSGARVVLTPLEGSDPVIKINSGGSGSTIRGLTITEGSYGIYVDSVSNCNITGNNISNNFNGIYLTNSTNNSITGNTITDTGVGIAYLDSDNTTITGNNITRSDIQDVQMIDTTGIVMSSTTSNCGPASLATVLQKLGINVSQDVLAAIAGTDEDGTTMYGLAQAARQQQGVFVKGLKLTVNELRPGNIVYLVIAGEKHYSIITSINGSIVYLADTDLGNINMTMGNFTAAYIQNTTSGYGYALVVTNNSTDPQLSNTNTLTDDEMKAIKGTSLSGWNAVAMGWYTLNPVIVGLARHIRRMAGSPNVILKAKAIWNWITNFTNYRYPTIHYFGHNNTWWGPWTVLTFRIANCAEMARLVVCLARAMGIPYYRVRYVHKLAYDRYGRQKITINPWTRRPEKVPGHYWAQIFCGYSPYYDWWNWKDLDCTMLFDHAGYFGGYMDNYGRFNGWRDRSYTYFGWEVS